MKPTWLWRNTAPLSRACDSYIKHRTRSERTSRSDVESMATDTMTQRRRQQQRRRRRPRAKAPPRPQQRNRVTKAADAEEHQQREPLAKGQRDAGRGTTAEKQRQRNNGAENVPERREAKTIQHWSIRRERCRKAMLLQPSGSCELCWGIVAGVILVSRVFGSWRRVRGGVISWIGEISYLLVPCDYGYMAFLKNPLKHADVESVTSLLHCDIAASLRIECD